MTSIRQRAARLAPYFRGGRSAWAVAVAASLVIAGTEVMTAKLMKPLIDQGFRDQAIPYWLIPLVIVGVFVARGLATFTAQYALAWSTSQSVIALRRAMFSQLQRAAPGLFSKYNASNLTNTVVYEVQNGAQLITSAVNTLLKDSLTLAGLLVSLLLQNWRLTLLVLVMVPTTGWVMRTASKRLRRLTDAGQKATDDLAYVMEENVLAWRIVRLHGASEGQTARFDSSNLSLRRILMKSVAAGFRLVLRMSGRGRFLRHRVMGTRGGHGRGLVMDVMDTLVEAAKDHLACLRLQHAGDADVDGA